MKKKLLNLILTACLIISSAFTLSACVKKPTCEHEWFCTNVVPTATSTGWISCNLCLGGLTEIPALNETDYVVDDTNPDYTTYTYNIDGYSFTFSKTNFELSITNGNQGKEYSIVGYNGNSSNVIIPEKIHGVYVEGGGDPTKFLKDIPVTCIEDEVFMNNTDLESVTLPNGLNWINDNAFSGCTNLTSVIFPDSIFGIGEAFSGCSNLTNVVLPQISTIANRAFANTGITEIVVPYECVMNGNNVFEGCNLTAVYHLRNDRDEWWGYDIKQAFNDAPQYFYSETKPTALDYLNNDGVLDTWHYGENNEKVLWTVDLTNHVASKSYVYSHSEVTFSDTYFAMLKEAEAQNMLNDLFDNDQTQVEMVTSSQTKAEYESKFASWYGTTMGTQAVISFTSDKVTVTLIGSTEINYIEINGEIYNTANKEKVFTFNATNNTIYEERVDATSTIKHVYSVNE